ncbi:MAG: DUF2142 domain-containing protein [Saprospiraceae bacterium]|nr:DUF2142 domain-containing protein [Saprospiraceae bacterium]
MLKSLLSEQPKIFKYWSIFTFFVGISLVFIVPPFQSPDEFNHFYRIYQISEGQLSGEIDSTKTQLGGFIPSSLITVSTYYEYIPFRKSEITSLDTLKKYISTPLEKDKKEFKAFPNTARYTFTTYLPQILTFSILRQLDTPPILILYIARLITFLFWFVLVNIAVLKTPIFKEIFMCFLLLPSSLAINSTINADVINNAFYFLIFMLFFRFREKTHVITAKELILFSTLLLITSINKLVYFPILGLLFLVKSPQFGGMIKKIYFIGFNIVLNLIVVLVINSHVHSLIYPIKGNIDWTTYEGLRPGYCVNPDQQIQLILEKPVGFIIDLAIKSVYAINNSLNSWIGCFGWESSIPNGLEGFFCLLLLSFVLLIGKKFAFWERVFLQLIPLSMIMLFLLSQHLHWGEVGAYILDDFNGKYFIPIFPLFYWSFSGLLSSFSQKKEQLVTFSKRFMVFAFVVLYIDFIILVIDRYYIV